jgi:hypothetical protein
LDGEEQQIAKAVIDHLQPNRPSDPAVVAGLERELVALYRRCHPLRNAIGRHFDTFSVGLPQWIKSQLVRCQVLDKALYEQSKQLIPEFVVLENRFTRDARE